MIASKYRKRKQKLAENIEIKIDRKKIRLRVYIYIIIYVLHFTPNANVLDTDSYYSTDDKCDAKIFSAHRH